MDNNRYWPNILMATGARVWCVGTLFIIIISTYINFKTNEKHKKPFYFHMIINLRRILRHFVYRCVCVCVGGGFAEK